MKEIPQFSAREINEVDDYERFFHTKAYLKKKSGKLTFFKDETDKIHELAEKSGYKKFNKFVEHRKEWHQMKSKIPRAYLKTIGVKLKVLKFTIELDQKEFEEVLEIPLYPQYATVRLHAAFYQSYSLPPDTSEKEAVQIMKEYAEKEERYCYINYPDIKTIGFRPDGSIYRIYYKPDIEITREYVFPTEGGERIGKIYFS
ncbi:MAG: hypothetical protein ACOC4G_14550 [Bacillota bacterium]